MRVLLKRHQALSRYKYARRPRVLQDSQKSTSSICFIKYVSDWVDSGGKYALRSSQRLYLVLRNGCCQNFFLLIVAPCCRLCVIISVDCVYLFLKKVLSVLQSPQVVLLVFVLHVLAGWLEVPDEIL